MLVGKIKPLLEQFFSREQPLLVGVSGGADSLCLLDLLIRLEYPVVVAHFHHGLRPEADDEAHSVEELAVNWGLPFAFGKASVSDFAQEHHLSVEEAARILRYRFLFTKANDYQVQAVAVAHNADDQVETVLMHLLRGTGLDGLTGMAYHTLPNPWSETIPLIRPLLNVWRAEIEAYCTEHGLAPLTDATNADTTYFRNRLRRELIPELESYIPGFRARLIQTSDLLATDRALLDDLAEKAWQEFGIENGPGYVILNFQSFNLQPLALRRRMMRRAIFLLRSDPHDVDFGIVQRALDFADTPTTTGQADLGLGLWISQEGNRLVISGWQNELPIDHWPQISAAYELPVPGVLELGNGWIFRVEIPLDLEDAEKKAHENNDPYQAWIDLGEWQSPMMVRPRRTGDRFQPLGMDGKSIKISDFMINEKIPQRAREGWPLVCVGDGITWVPGYRLSHPYRVTERSRQIVRLFLLQTR